MLTLMTFNIRYGLAEDGVNCWENRKSLVSDRIRAHDPDLLGLQECREDSLQAGFIRENLLDYEFYGVPRGGRGSTALEMAPILVKKSAFRLADKGYFWLSETPHVPASLSWGATFPRTATWARLVHIASGRHLTFLNTHFDYTPSALENSARVIQAWVKQEAEAHSLLITGDFNADKKSSAYQLLTTGSSLFDIHPADEGTYHGYGQANDPIDWMLASDSFRVVSAATDRFHAGNVYPSDHYPVHAKLEWKP